MSTATEDKIHGKFDEVAGKVKQHLGEATDNDSLANEGTVQQVKGHGEQAWGSVKQAASDTIAEAKTHHEENSGQTKHDARESVASAAQSVKEFVRGATDDK
jgi:uncharacterized protein YjbJ (UPF0337 family)